MKYLLVLLGWAAPWWFFSCGVVGLLRWGYLSQVAFLPLPGIGVYAAYPSSLFVFAGIGAICAYKYRAKAFPCFALCLSLFDLAGSIVGREITPVSFFFIWEGIIISCLLFLKLSLNKFWPSLFILPLSLLIVGGTHWSNPILPYHVGEIVAEALWGITFLASVETK